MANTGFFGELKRRRVWQVAGAYIAIAWLATEIATFLFEQADAPGWTIRLLAIVFIVGFPLAVTLAWIVQVAPDGERHIDRSTGQGKTVAAAIALGIAATVGLAWLILPRIDDTPDYEPIPDSVAVLPLAVEDSTPRARNVADTLVTALRAGFEKSVEVRQVMLYDRPDDLASYGRQYRVAALLTGTVAHAADKLTIAMELLDLRTMDVRWTHSFDWDATRIAENGTDVANGVLAALGLPAMTTHRFTGTDSREAYDAYLQGRQNQRIFNIAEMRLAIADFERAVELDPEYVHAWYELGRTTDMYVDFKGPAPDERGELEKRRDDAFEAARQLDPDFPPIISYLGSRTEDLELIYRALDRALELDPDHALTYFRYSSAKAFEGRNEEAEELIRKALDFEPRNARFHTQLGNVLWRLSRDEEAFAEVDLSIALEPRLSQNYQMLAAINAYVLGNLDQSVYNWRKAYELNPEAPFLAGFCGATYANLGMREEALAWRDRALELGPTQPWVWVGARIIHERLGDLDGAREFQKREAELFGDFIENPVELVTVDPDIEIGLAEDYLAEFEMIHPELLTTEAPVVDGSNFWDLQQYAAALIQARQRERAIPIIDALIAALEHVCTDGREIAGTGYDYCDGFDVLYASKLDKDGTLRELRREIVDRHRRYATWHWNQPLYDFVRDEPEFIELMDYLQADLAKQAQRVREMQCSGELPPAPGVNFTPDCGPE